MFLNVFVNVITGEFRKGMHYVYLYLCILYISQAAWSRASLNSCRTGSLPMIYETKSSCKRLVMMNRQPSVKNGATSYLTSLTNPSTLLNSRFVSLYKIVWSWYHSNYSPPASKTWGIFLPQYCTVMFVVNFKIVSYLKWTIWPVYNYHFCFRWISL